MRDDADKEPPAGDAGEGEAHAAPAGAGEQAPAGREIGGPKGPEPTRYGDWEVGGRCSDF